MGERSSLDELLSANMAMSSDGVLDGVKIERVDGENTVNFGKFLNILGQVCRFLMPQLDEHDYSWNEIIGIVKESGVLRLRAKNIERDGQTVGIVNDDDVVSILEATRWVCMYKATGIAHQIVPMAVETEKQSGSMWNTFAIRDMYDNKGIYEPYYLLTGETMNIVRLGKTILNPSVTGKILDNRSDVSMVCPICGKTHIITLSRDSLEKYKSNVTIDQKSFPTLDDFQRGSLISHMCFDCQEKTFHRPAPGHEAEWGKWFAECDVCGASIWDPKDRDKDGKLVCHCCGTPYGVKGEMD